MTGIEGGEYDHRKEWSSTLTRLSVLASLSAAELRAEVGAEVSLPRRGITCGPDVGIRQVMVRKAEPGLVKQGWVRQPEKHLPG